jgi:hypothetical protein
VKLWNLSEADSRKPLGDWHNSSICTGSPLSSRLLLGRRETSGSGSAEYKREFSSLSYACFFAVRNARSMRRMLLE